MTQVVLETKPRQRTEAEQLFTNCVFVFVCLDLWFRQFAQKQSLFSRARGTHTHLHTHTEGLVSRETVNHSSPGLSPKLITPFPSVTPLLLSTLSGQKNTHTCGKINKHSHSWNVCLRLPGSHSCLTLSFTLRRRGGHEAGQNSSLMTHCSSFHLRAACGLFIHGASLSCAISGMNAHTHTPVHISSQPTVC